MNLTALRDYVIKPVEHSYAARDCILYALGLGYGSEPNNPDHLQFVYEIGLKVVPSICNVLAHPGFWISDPMLGIDWLKILHGEQAFDIVKPLPADARVRGTYRIMALEDKGDRGAVLHVEKRLSDADSGELLVTVSSVYMLRGDGGQGGFGEPPPAAAELPDVAPDLVIDIATRPETALIYRLSGDLNPIHADPAAASKAGFSGPILHGLCSMGVATRALLGGIAANDPDQLKHLSLRFSRPVFPGETIRTEIFRTADGARFRARSLERDVVVMDRGTATLRLSQ